VGVIGAALKSDVFERGAHDRHISATSKPISDQGTSNFEESVQLKKLEEQAKQITYFWK
jgi:hypothetical protein